MSLLLLDEMAPISFLFNIVAFLVLVPYYVVSLRLLLGKSLQNYGWGMCLAVGLILIGVWAATERVLDITKEYQLLIFLFPFLTGVLSGVFRFVRHLGKRWR
ncbi:MAG TPA: hypothetical protein VF629_00750 [Hymenobacter sp.]|jgi:hypothetical membrane protein|uniref:hypothetical protein n=1 Tax=Hymenobacter sp. TaxID=1898978 RepID=UPI002ED9FA79